MGEAAFKSKAVSLRNDSDALMTVYLEPWPEAFHLPPGARLEIRSSQPIEVDDVLFHNHLVTIWFNGPEPGDYTVYIGTPDHAGRRAVSWAEAIPLPAEEYYSGRRP
jgi:hypothetical protein